MAKRFKQVDEDSRAPRPEDGAPRPAAHARHAAPHPDAAPRPRPRSASGQATPRAATGRPAAGAPTPRRGSRFADAARATSDAHRFPKLGGTSTSLVPGQVPVTSSGAHAGSPYAADDAPRPIGVDPATTGSFRTIRASQGAVVSTRETASRAAGAAREALGSSDVMRADARRRRSEKPAPSKAPKGVVAGIVVACVVIIVLGVTLARALIEPTSGPDEAATTVAQTSVSSGDGVSVSGATYTTRQAGSGWELVRGSGDGGTTVAQLSGTPVAICLHEGTLFVPENLSDGTWDIICYVVADGSTATQLLGDDGQPVVGSGELSSAEVDGDAIVLTDASGAQTRASLV